MTTPAEYTAWLDSAGKQPVYLASIVCKDGSILRPSTERYRDASSIWRSRVPDFTFQWGISGESGGRSKYQVGDIEIVNLDAQMDAWRVKNMQSIVVVHGDRRWDYSDFVTVFTGIPASPIATEQSLRVALRDNQYLADVTLPSVTLLDGLPGAMVLELLTSPQGPFNVANIDTAAFTKLDTDYPYTCTLNPAGADIDLYKTVDQILSGFPVDWGVDNEGVLTLFELSNATGASSFRTIKPTSWQSIKIIEPVGSVTINGEFVSETTIQTDNGILADYPNARKLEFTTRLTTLADADALALQWLALESQPHDLVPIKTDRNDQWKPGDEIPVQFPRYGYESGQFGIIQSMTRKGESQELILRV